MHTLEYSNDSRLLGTPPEPQKLKVHVGFKFSLLWRLSDVFGDHIRQSCKEDQRSVVQNWFPCPVMFFP